MNLPGRDAGHTAGGTPSPVSAAYGYGYDSAGRLKPVSAATAGFIHASNADGNLIP